MYRADSITKGFLQYGQPRVSTQTDKILQYEDPTYIGFQWRIIDTHDYSKGSGAFDLDYFPQGLFLAENDTDSAISYCVRTGQLARAEMLREFRIEFLALLKNAPWYFTKVTGLADIWKIDPKISFRGKDKKLTFETFEALDLKMTYLMDLYRKATFDPVWMRYAIPENQRMFAMELVIGEIRPMHISQKGFQRISNDGTFPGYITDMDMQGSFSTYEKKVDDTAAASPSMSNVYGPGGPEIALITNIKNTLESLSNNATPNNDASSIVKAPWSPSTFLSFRFDYCTFDVLGQAPTYMETITKSPIEPAKNTIIVNTPFISEVNSYGLLGTVLRDSYYQSDYTYDIKRMNAVANKWKDMGEGANNDTARTEAQIGDVRNKFLQNLSTAAQERVLNLINTAASGLFLGNVYGIGASSILGAIESFLNNPLAAVEQAITNFTSVNQPGPTPAPGNVSLTGPEIKLVKDIIGIAVEDGVLGNPDLVKNTIGIAVEDNITENPNLIMKEKKNVNLTGPDIVKQRLGNIYKA